MIPVYAFGKILKNLNSCCTSSKGLPVDKLNIFVTKLRTEVEYHFYKIPLLRF